MTNKTQRINFEGKEYKIDARARFVARDSNGTIWAYEGKPAWGENDAASGCTKPLIQFGASASTK